MHSAYFKGIAISLFGLSLVGVAACSGAESTGTQQGESTSSDPTSPPPNEPSSATTSSGGSTPPSASSSSSGSVPSTVDAGTDSAPTSGGKAKDGDTCNADGDCASSVCFHGGQGSYCSYHCTNANSATVCAPPVFNGSCNKQGFCRKP